MLKTQDILFLVNYNSHLEIIDKKLSQFYGVYGAIPETVLLDIKDQALWPIEQPHHIWTNSYDKCEHLINIMFTSKVADKPGEFCILAPKDRIFYCYNSGRITRRTYKC